MMNAYNNLKLRYATTMKEHESLLEKAEKKLHDSEICFEKFGDEDSKKWIEEDKAEVERIKKNIEKVKSTFARKFANLI